MIQKHFFPDFFLSGNSHYKYIQINFTPINLAKYISHLMYQKNQSH